MNYVGGWVDPISGLDEDFVCMQVKYFIPEIRNAEQ
jgi:hypothetical protein